MAGGERRERAEKSLCACLNLVYYQTINIIKSAIIMC